MPAQGLSFIFNILFLTVIVPVTTVNFLIVNTRLIPQIKSFIITTSSMNPSIPKGSLIYTVKKDKYKVGDIITFKGSVGSVVHRIAGITVLSGVLYYKTKGDANTTVDGDLVEVNNIYGKVQMQIPLIGDTVLILRKFI